VRLRQCRCPRGCNLVGASADFGRVTGYVVGSTTSGRGDGNGYGVTVGVRVPL